MNFTEEETRKLIEACSTLDRLAVGDFTYNIRDRDHVREQTPEEESTWNHPDVKAWSDASVIISQIAKKYAGQMG